MISLLQRCLYIFKIKIDAHVPSPSQFSYMESHRLLLITLAPLRIPSAPLRERLNWTTLHRRSHNFILYQVDVSSNKLDPTLSTIASSRKIQQSIHIATCRANKFHLSRPCSEFYRLVSRNILLQQAPNECQSNPHPTFS